MLDIIKDVELFIEKYGIKGTVLVAFSGGYDSMCLLDVMSKLAPKYEINLKAIHLNHNWRGDESKEEAVKAEKFANLKGIEFYSEILDSNIQHTETAARDARYEFFKNCAKKFNSEYILTAHNLNDNAETIIYRFIKGTGMKGLCGIAENREIFYRPLLNIQRSEIEKYCKLNSLLPNFDSSNDNTKYKRNLIRKEILPVMREINPSVLTAINSLCEILKSDNEIIEEYLIKVIKKITKNGKILTSKFIKLPGAVQQRLIYNLLQATNTDYDKKKVLEILDFIKENSSLKCGKTKSLTSDLWVWAGSKYVEIITSSSPVLNEVEIIGEGDYLFGKKIFRIENCLKFPEKFPQDNEFVAYVNLDNVDFPLNLRTRRDGDKIVPLGSDGSQKLKKYLNSKAVPKHERDKIILLTKNSEVLWVAGFGINEKIKADGRVTHKIKISDKN